LSRQDVTDLLWPREKQDRGIVIGYSLYVKRGEYSWLLIIYAQDWEWTETLMDTMDRMLHFSALLHY
jgi:hypothetical protein